LDRRAARPDGRTGTAAEAHVLEAREKVIAGIGFDLVDIARVDRLLDAKGERALRRLFTASEVDYALSRPLPAQHLAARLAAKEAAFKALAGNSLARGIGWREIEVVRRDERPTLAFHGRAAERIAELGVTNVWVSLTHSGTTAGAMVVLEVGGALNSHQGT
jgi:holo-[acyl-carrier protein] synthase